MKNIALIYSNYYPEITTGLKNDFYQTVKDNSFEANFSEFEVFGSFELPLKLKAICRLDKFDAVVLFGCIVQGETLHHDLINSSIFPAILSISIEYDMPVGVSILTVKNMKQALKRSSGDKNRGREAFYAIRKFFS